jgi:hypothetical protein
MTTKAYLPMKLFSFLEHSRIFGMNKDSLSFTGRAFSPLPFLKKVGRWFQMNVSHDDKHTECWATLYPLKITFLHLGENIILSAIKIMSIPNEALQKVSF